LKATGSIVKTRIEMSVPETFPVARTLDALRSRIAQWRRDAMTVGLVPTMGALHDGHLALVSAAGAACDRVVVSIFVNPSQFGPNEDFAAYPRREAEDLAKLAAAGVHLAWMPGVADMYPPGFATRVSVGALTDRLEGAFRPGHFEGVATVVTKLLSQVRPDAAWFGEKDYQQLLVIRRLVGDLDIPVRIEAVTTLRESDGLALSSRNFYLSDDERRRAAVLPRVLGRTADAMIATPRRPFAPLREAALGELAAAGFGPIDYIALCDAATLDPLTVLDRPARLLAAARLGRTRLIDNLALRPPTV
jgi:pantoate--beta-alanine ligase